MVRFKIANLDSNSLKNESAKQELAIATLISTGITRKDNTEKIGDLWAVSDRNEEASMAYATIYQGGMKTPEIENRFRSVRDKAPVHESSFRNNISTAPVLDDQLLEKQAGGLVW